MKNLLVLLAFVFAVSLTAPAQTVDKKEVKKDVKKTLVTEKNKKEVTGKKECKNGASGCCSDMKESKKESK